MVRLNELVTLDRDAMYIVAPVPYRILISSYPTAPFPPVTMKTLPYCEGTSFSVKEGLGGNHWLHRLRKDASTMMAVSVYSSYC